MKKKVIGLSLALVMGLGTFTACSSSEPTEVPSSTESGSEATAYGIDSIVFGTNPEFPPFEYISTDGVIGEFDGIDMSIVVEIGERLGVDVSVEQMEFDSLIVALGNGQIDACIAGMTVTEERKESVNFTEPYYTATQVMIVPEDSDIEKASDMEGKKITVVQGYTGEVAVKKLGYDYEAFKKGTECILELTNGKCDVVVIDSATAEAYIKDNEGLKIVEDPEVFEAEEYAIAVNKDNEELLKALDTVIKDMKSEGKIAEISASYLDSSAE